MKIKELLKICKESTNQNSDVYIPSIDYKGNQISTPNVGYNFDDDNNLELYEISK
jgi:hypothetical protein